MCGGSGTAVSCWLRAARRNVLYLRTGMTYYSHVFLLCLGFEGRVCELMSSQCVGCKKGCDLKMICFKKFGFDFHTSMMLLMRLWTMFAGLVMMLGLPYWLTSEQQGYYFTFYSILGLQVFFEMGLNYVIVQVSAHEMANLVLSENGEVQGPKAGVDRMISLVNLTRQWYFFIALLFFMVVAIGGIVFFKTNAEVPVFEWIGPWLTLVILTAINLYVSPLLSIMEGSGLVGQVYRVRLIASVLGFSCAWCFLALGNGLWAIVFPALLLAFVTFYWVFGRKNFIAFALRKRSVDLMEAISWRDDIFPFQWKIAVSWMSGYLIFQFINPVIFSTEGAVVAGKVGLALTAYMAILSASMSWVNAKAPVCGKLLAKGNNKEAKAVFLTSMWRSSICNLSGCIFFILLAMVLRRLDSVLAARLPDMFVMSMLAFATISNHAVSGLAVYIRCHKEEPLLVSSLSMAVFIVCGICVSVNFGVDVMMAVYAALSAFVGLPWCVWIFKKYWN